jgi:hypothetical protein
MLVIILVIFYLNSGIRYMWSWLRCVFILMISVTVFLPRSSITHFSFSLLVQVLQGLLSNKTICCTAECNGQWCSMPYAGVFVFRIKLNVHVKPEKLRPSRCKSNV